MSKISIPDVPRRSLTPGQRRELYEICCSNTQCPETDITRAIIRYELASGGLIELRNGYWVATPMGRAAI